MQLLRALVIDDNEPRRASVRMLLEASCFDCWEVPDLIYALACSSDHGIDLIVLHLGVKRVPGLGISTVLDSQAFGITPPPVIGYFDAFSAVTCLIPSPVTGVDLERALHAAFTPLLST
jgi:CheY-like chemotaxis protein